MEDQIENLELDEDSELERADEAVPESIEAPAPPDRAAHLESGASEFSRRFGGALISQDLPEQYAERDRNLESEHAQNPDELGVAFVLGATQGEPADERPEEEQASEDVEEEEEEDEI